MLFCGTTFCGLKHTLDLTPTYQPQTDPPNDDIKLENGIYNELYIDSSSADIYNPQYSTDIPQEWLDNTVLHARFNGNVSAGNVDYFTANATAFLLKRRAKDSGEDWVNIALLDHPTFLVYDRYARSGVEYEYNLVPLENNIEGYFSMSAEILSEFEGVFIMEKDVGYHALINIKMATVKNRPSAVINTIDSKYPYVVTNGQNNYYSGSTSSVFINTQGDLQHMYDWEWYNSRQYRDDFMEFLCNGNPKVLKHFDGRIFLISVVDTPSQDESVSNFYPTTTFNWVEIGDTNNPMDLYINNLSDYDGGISGGA